MQCPMASGPLSRAATLNAAVPANVRITRPLRSLWCAFAATVLLAAASSFGSLQTLGGQAVDGNLRVGVQDDGRIGIERYVASSGQWVRQVFATYAKGSRVQWSGGAYSLGYYGGSYPSQVSNTKSGNTVTTVLDCGPVRYRQEVTYVNGNAYVSYAFKVTNNGGSTLSDLRFFHGDDTYLLGGDNGAGFWDALNNTIGVQKRDAGGTMQKMSLQGVTVPHAYESRNYYYCRQSVNAGALTNAIDNQESTDNGYALEWRRSSLMSGDTWTIYAHEKFGNVQAGGLVVNPPISAEITPGGTIDITYSVQSTTAGSQSVALSVATDLPGWSASIVSPSSPVSIPGGGSETITVRVTAPASAGSGAACRVTLTATGNTTASDFCSVTATQQSQSISFSPIPAKTYGDGPFDAGATASSGLPVSYSSSNPLVAVVDGSQLTITGVGTSVITASQAGDANYSPAPDVSQTLTVNKASQTISFARIPAATYGDDPFDLSVSASSGLAVELSSSNPLVATVNGTLVTIVGAGTATITASQPGDANHYAAADVARTLTAAKASQSITFDALSETTYGDDELILDAAASSGLAVTYTSSDPMVAAINGSTVTIVNAGTTVITASQAGNANYEAAGEVTRTLVVNKAAQTITFEAPGDKTYGDEPWTLQATATSGLDVAFASSDAEIIAIENGIAVINGAGTTQITASQAGGSNYHAAPDVVHTVTVHKAEQSISLVSLLEVTYGDGTHELPRTASSGLAISYSSSDEQVAREAGGKITIGVAGEAVITAAQPGDDNHEAAQPVTCRVVVAKKELVLTADNKARRYWTLNPPLTISYDGFVNGDDVSDITPPSIGTTAQITSPVGEYPITLSGGAADNYDLTLVNGTFTIMNGTQSITFPELTTKTYGDPVFEIEAWATSGLPVRFASSDTSVARISNDTLTITGAGAAVITASQPGTGDIDAAEDVSRTLTVEPGVLIVSVGSEMRAYGAANPSFTFEYDGLVYGDDESVVEAPTATCSADERSEPGDYPIALSGGSADNYTLELIDGVLTVVQADQMISFEPLQTRGYGDAPFTLTATASSGLPVCFTSADSSIAAVHGDTVLIRGAGTVTIIASQPGGSDFGAAPDVQHVLTIAKAPLVVRAVDTSRVYGAANPRFALAYEGFVNGDDASAVTPPEAACGAGAGSEPGDYPITLNGGSADNYDLQLVHGTLHVVQAGQTITFDPLAGKTFGDEPFELSAASSSGLTVTFNSSDTSVATVDGRLVTIVGAGTAVITASQSGDQNIGPALDVQQSLTVAKAPQTLTLDAPDTIAVGNAPCSLTVLSSSGLPATVRVSDTLLARIDDGLLHAVSAGVVTLVAGQEGNEDYLTAPQVSLNVVVRPRPRPAAPMIIVENKNDTVTADSVLLSWEDMGPSILRYRLIVATDSAMTLVVMDDSTLDTSAAMMCNLRHNARYFWQVMACNESGWGEASETMSFQVLFEMTRTLPTEVRFNVHAMQAGLQRLRCALPRETVVFARLYQLSGRVVWDFSRRMPAGYHTIVLPRVNLSEGAFVMEVMADGRLWRQKLSVAR